MHLAKRSQPRLKLYALMPGKKGLRNDDTDMTKRHGSALIMKLYAVKAISTALKSFMGLLIVGTCDKRIDQWASARWNARRDSGSRARLFQALFIIK